MKLNFNYCLLITLTLIILVSCLGSLLYEGFSNNKDTHDKDDKHDKDEYHKHHKHHKHHKDDKDKLGDDEDIYGCLPSAGEKWCSTTRTCIKPFEEDCPSEDDKEKNANNAKNGEQFCGKDTIWDKAKKLCMNKLYKSDKKREEEEEDNEKNKNELDNNYSYENNYKNPEESFNQKQNNSDFMLKTKIVPPVCPACPPITSCPSNKKCPPCPAPEPIQPCPPCERCPEPSFKCEKVPNYTSINNELLPRPLLSDFSGFGN